jgi:hypothetical protein
VVIHAGSVNVKARIAPVIVRAFGTDKFVTGSAAAGDRTFVLGANPDPQVMRFGIVGDGTYPPLPATPTTTTIPVTIAW